MEWFNKIKLALVALVANVFNPEMSEAEVHQALIDLKADGGFISKKEFDAKAAAQDKEIETLKAELAEAKKTESNENDSLKAFQETFLAEMKTLKEQNDALSTSFDALKKASADEINDLKTTLAKTGKGGKSNGTILEDGKDNGDGKKTEMKADFMDEFLSKTPKYTRL